MSSYLQKQCYLECLTLSNCTVVSNLSDPIMHVQSAVEGSSKTKLFHSLRNLVISSNISPSQVSY